MRAMENLSPRLAALAPVALLAAALLATAPLAAQDPETQGRESSSSLRARALTAYAAGDWAACAELYAESAEGTARRAATALFNAACCAVHNGEADRAVALLDRSLAAGWRDAYGLREDADLAPLHDHPAWPRLVAGAGKAQAAFAERVNAELYRMYQVDQAARSQPDIDWKALSADDAARRERAAEILAAGEATEPEDFFHAAILFQHGERVEDYARARELAARAVELDPEYTEAKWLTAAATDRWLHRQGEPQIYGTQFRKDTPDGPWTLEPLDPDAVSDEERMALGVPPLAEARRRLEQMNAPPEEPAEPAADEPADAEPVPEKAPG